MYGMELPKDICGPKSGTLMFPYHGNVAKVLKNLPSCLYVMLHFFAFSQKISPDFSPFAVKKCARNILRKKIESAVQRFIYVSWEFLKDLDAGFQNHLQTVIIIQRKGGE